jgi:hypothetical protein
VARFVLRLDRPGRDSSPREAETRTTADETLTAGGRPLQERSRISSLVTVSTCSSLSR